MGFGGTGGSAAAVPAGAAAQQDHHIPGQGRFPAHIGGGSGGDDRADFHALGGVAVVIDFIHLTGGQADLIAIRGIARRRGGGQLPLGQLAGQRLGNRDGWGPPRQ